nr:unnamed protein product [Digitaria exilis]
MPATVAAAAAAAASGGAFLLYLLITCRPQPPPPEAERGAEGDEASPLLRGSGAESDREEEPWPDRAPVTCCEAAAVAARTARRTWELTVGRWGLHGIAFGIKRHMKRQGNLQHEYSGNDCRQLKGHQAHTEVSSLLEYLKLCMFFSKKSFSAFLKFGGYKQEDILIHKARARVIGHSMGAGIGSILTYILREHYEFSSCSCLAFAPPACMTWELAESGKDFITSLVNRNDVVPAISKVSSESLRSEVMVSSKLDDLQDHFHHNLFASISQRVAFFKSHMLSVSHSSGKIADHDSSISEPLLKDAADVIQPAANGHSIVVTSEERVTLVNNEDVTCVKSAVSILVSQEDSDSNGALDTDQSSLSPNEGKEVPNQDSAGKDKQKEPISASGSRQFFPPGRIIHMVALPPPDLAPGEGTSSNEIIGIYETPRELYGRIRLAPNMIKEHYMPSYISTMESLLEQLQKDDGDNTVCTTSNDL